MKSKFINIVVEDQLHEAILKKIFKYLRNGIEINTVYGLRGKDYIKNKIKNYNLASKIIPYVILTDLDTNVCPPTLLKEWIDFEITENFIFRIAVKEAEAWLIGDKINFSKFMGISSAKIKGNSEHINNPKEYIGELAKQSMRKEIRDSLIPQGTAKVGKTYNTTMVNFVFSQWRVEIARSENHSLDRAVRKLETIYTS